MVLKAEVEYDGLLWIGSGSPAEPARELKTKHWRGPIYPTPHHVGNWRSFRRSLYDSERSCTAI
jgi:hypothetical protein